MSGLPKATDSNIQELIKNNNILIIKFFAIWCKPCASYAVTCEEFAKKHQEIKIYEMDIDSEINFSTSSGVRGVPSTAIYVNSEYKDMLVGAVSLSQLEDFVKKNTSN